MNFLLALLSAAAHSMNSVAIRTYQTRLQQNMADFRLYQAVVAAVVALSNLILSGFAFELDRMGFWLSLCYGLDLALTGILTAMCFACGPMSLTSVITNACVLLPIAVGCIWYGEVMTPPQIIGCLLLAGCFVLSAINPKKKASEKTEIQPKWYLMVFLAFFFNGMGAVLLNIYGRVAAAGQRNSYLALGYFVSALIYLANHAMIRRHTGPVAFRKILCPILPVLLLMSSMGGFIGNSILMSLNTAMPASLLYPLVNGGIAVIVAIASCVIFREKLTMQRLLTILTGLAAIVALNL